MLAPAEITLDTSFVYGGLSPAEDDYGPCSDFLDALADAGAVLYYSRLLEIELREAAVRAALRERWGRKWRDRLTDMRAMRRARPFVKETMAAWESLVSGNITVPVEVGEVEERVTFLMVEYGLHSYDAVHVATALHVRAPVIATLDKGFAVIPADAITLRVPPSRVEAARTVRGGSSVAVFGASLDGCVTERGR